MTNKMGTILVSVKDAPIGLTKSVEGGPFPLRLASPQQDTYS